MAKLQVKFQDQNCIAKDEKCCEPITSAIMCTLNAVNLDKVKLFQVIFSLSSSLIIHQQPWYIWYKCNIFCTKNPQVLQKPSHTFYLFASHCEKITLKQDKERKCKKHKNIWKKQKNTFPDIYKKGSHDKHMEKRVCKKTNTYPLCINFQIQSFCTHYRIDKYWWL